MIARSAMHTSRYASTPRRMRSAPAGVPAVAAATDALYAVVEAGVKRVDERLPIVEVHVEGALGDAGLGDHPVDTQA